MSYRTDEKTPPPFFMCAYFERSCNPFDPAIIAEALGGKKVKEKPEFDIEPGFFDDGRMFAYPKTECSIELKERHKKEIEKRKAATNER